MEMEVNNWPLFLLFLLTVGVFVAALMVTVRYLIQK